MRRSRFIALVSMGTATLALTACEDATQTTVFENLDQCVQSRLYSQEECQANFQAATTVHRQAAPTFASRSDCEADFGAGQCEPAPQQQQQQAAHGGGSLFMPLMLGYMMGSMSSAGRAVQPQPLYRAYEGGARGPFRTAGGTSVAARPGPTTVDAKSAVAKAPTRSATLARGGFGGRAASFASAGG